MEINCTENELLTIKKVANAAQALGMEAYLIGGFVRDKLLGRETKDADFVCVGDGIVLAKEVAKQFNPVPQIDVFKNFGTAHIKIFRGIAKSLAEERDQRTVLYCRRPHPLHAGSRAHQRDSDRVGQRRQRCRF